MNTKTKNSSRHFHFSETLETSSNMGKRTGSLHFGQPEQPPPEGRSLFHRHLLPAGLRGRGRRRPGCRGHCRPVGHGPGDSRAAETRGLLAGQGPALQPARQSPSPEAPPSHPRTSGTAHSPCPAHAVIRGFENTELQETFPCSFPGPQTNRVRKTYGENISTLCVFPSLAVFKDSFLFLHLQWHIFTWSFPVTETLPCHQQWQDQFPSFDHITLIRDPLSSGTHWVSGFSAGGAIFMNHHWEGFREYYICAIP